jgi:hypothetical protein
MFEAVSLRNILGESKLVQFIDCEPSRFSGWQCATVLQRSNFIRNNS